MRIRRLSRTTPPARAFASAALVLALTVGSVVSLAAARAGPIAEAFPLVFDSERIRLEIVGDSLEVRGTYVLLCRERGEPPPPLFYPFPRDSLMGGFRMVSLSVRSSPGSSPTPVCWETVRGVSAVRWWLPGCSGDTIVAEATYRQKLDANYARYIVTTTRAWGRPLRHASFEIRLPPTAVPVDFSFPFEPRDGGTRYGYEASDFFPDRDIIVRWRE
jgi:hypothetical protein